MGLEYAVVDIKYDICKDHLIFGGNIGREGRRELIQTFLEIQKGKGTDKRKPNKNEIYYIKLSWYPEDDKIKVEDNTGNRGLRDGILLRCLEKLGK